MAKAAKAAKRSDDEFGNFRAVKVLPGPVQLQQLEPAVLRQGLRECCWPALQWDLEVLQREHGQRQVPLRFGQPGRTPWEGQCERLDNIPLGDFCLWLCGKEVSSIPYLKEQWWGYCSYQHFEALFEDMEDCNRSSANFLDLLKEENANAVTGAPTFWLGSKGARTPCHQDAYGYNIVAQIAGEKRWLLFEPNSSWLGAHRLPFEDSSTFTDVDPFETGVVAGLQVVLHPGDVLVVPRHWFHAVECISDWSLSLNQWFDAPGDTQQRVHEAITRCLASPFLEVRPESWWLNPDEEVLDISENIEYLTSALQVNLGREVDVAAAHAALLRAATRPEVVTTIAQLVTAELESKKQS